MITQAHKSTQTQFCSATLLVVEDDDIDVIAIKRALGDMNLTNKIVHLKDGISTLDYLRNTPENMPFIIFLDLNLPKISGIEFLKLLRADPKHTATPVIILTTSEADSDIVGTYRQNIMGYIVKSDLKESLKEIINPDHFHFAITAKPNFKSLQVLEP